MKSVETVNLAGARPVKWWVAAAIVPLLAFAASLVVNVDPRLWLTLPRRVLQALAADALLYSVGVLIVAAPLVGVAAASGWKTGENIVSIVSARSRRAGAWLEARNILTALTLFVGVSAIVFTIAWGTRSEGLIFIATSHATLASAAVALVMFGAFCATWLRDPLDAAACALMTVLIVTGGVLVAGAPVADAPRSLVDAALVASPLVGIASAASIDIVRMDVLYQISPLSHIGFDYPAWYTASAWYLAAAAACAAAIALKTWTSDTVSLT
jgi:hypothetical protein